MSFLQASTFENICPTLYLQIYYTKTYDRHSKDLFIYSFSYLIFDTNHCWWQQEINFSKHILIWQELVTIQDSSNQQLNYS